METAVRGKETKQQETREEKEVISYRMKCTESGNGLSHYIMYGDVPEEVQ
jgi:hypothetical protein